MPIERCKLMTRKKSVEIDLKSIWKIILAILILGLGFVAIFLLMRFFIGMQISAYN